MFTGKFDADVLNLYIMHVVVSLKGEVHPKMITSYLVVFGALSRMVKVRGAYDEPFLDIKAIE